MIWDVSVPWSLSWLLPWRPWLALGAWIFIENKWKPKFVHGLGCVCALEPVLAPALASLARSPSWRPPLSRVWSLLLGGAGGPAPAAPGPTAPSSPHAASCESSFPASAPPPQSPRAPRTFCRPRRAAAAPREGIQAVAPGPARTPCRIRSGDLRTPGRDRPWNRARPA